MLDETSVTEWISRLRAGDVKAAQPIWEHYFERLVGLVNARFPPRGYIDGEDVALSAFGSCVVAIRRGRFPQLQDRDDLWRILVFSSLRKVSKVIDRENAVVHGGGVDHADLCAISLIAGQDPSPEVAAEVAEDFRLLIESLSDDTLRRIALWKMESYTNEEIAARLGCSLKTVSNKLRLIRMRLEMQGHG